MSVTKCKSLDEFIENLNGRVPVLKEAIVRDKETNFEHYSMFDSIIRNGVFNMELMIKVIEKWKWEDTLLEIGIPDEEMFCRNEVPVRLVSLKGKENVC